MKVKAKASYSELSNEDNFLALGSASTHLKLVAGETVEIAKSMIPLSKELNECLSEIKSKKGDK
tara:strand:- start:242 stop:433 length:192 start_codon:yes stop_codon:yes gene_type:complete